MKTNSTTLTPDLLQRMDAYWRAANYLSVGQIYLYDNPLLKRPLTLADVKHMLLGHWGTTPGQNFIYTHLNRVIKKYDLDMIYVSGPGHGGPAVVAGTYLEGTYSEIYPNISRDEAGLRKLFLQFSFPGGIPSHASPECPGSIHEGGELGYSLSHSFGAVFDNPELVVACVVGDGEAETGPLATAWHSNKFLDPVTDGAVLPILHLNGYKISNPTILARITREELEQLLRGYGWTPYFVEGHEPALMHEAMAATLDTAIEQIKKIQADARVRGITVRPRWPMIVLNSPKGWTGPKMVDGLPNEGTFRAHQVPLSVSPSAPPEHLKQLEDWLRSYRPDELFDSQGHLKPELAELAPKGWRRMGANPHANGGILLRDLRMPDFCDYAVEVPAPGVRGIGDTHVLGRFLRDVAKLNQEQRNFRVFGPDETLSNGLEALFEVTKRQWEAATVPGDEFLAPAGRVMEMLSEHQCEGWLEGYMPMPWAECGSRFRTRKCKMPWRSSAKNPVRKACWYVPSVDRPTFMCGPFPPLRQFSSCCACRSRFDRGPSIAAPVENPLRPVNPGGPEHGQGRRRPEPDQDPRIGRFRATTQRPSRPDPDPDPDS